MVYDLLKFLHVAGAIAWVGGALTVTVLTARLASEPDIGAQAVLSDHAARLGQVLLGPAAALTLLAGMATSFAGGIDVTLWIAWGYLGVIGSIALGVTVIRRTTSALASAAADGGPQARIASLRRRVVGLQTLNIVLLLTVVAAMVFKPTL